MADKIAIKKLTASDCTLFEAVFRKIGAGNQKSINLNADILVEKFYPNLSTGAPFADTEIALPLKVYGPAAKGAYKIARKIVKNATYKNWRLNGEFIHGPLEDPSRYDDILPGDLAVMIFKGEGAPIGLDLILVSQTAMEDRALHTQLGALFENRSMIVATPTQISDAAAVAGIPEVHPIFLAATDPAMEAILEDAAQGGVEGITKLLKNRGGKRTSASELAKAKAKAELTGQNGEGLVNAYLAGLLAAGGLTEYTWESAENAVAPYDFATITPDGQRTLIDAKSTNGVFENTIHLSLAEIIEAAGKTPYRIYRVFGLSEDGGQLRISDDIRPLAKQLKAMHETHVPTGVRVDSFSVAISAFSWGAVEDVSKPDGDDPA